MEFIKCLFRKRRQRQYRRVANYIDYHIRYLCYDKNRVNSMELYKRLLRDFPLWQMKFMDAWEDKHMVALGYKLYLTPNASTGLYDSYWILEKKGGQE